MPNFRSYRWIGLIPFLCILCMNDARAQDNQSPSSIYGAKQVDMVRIILHEAGIYFISGKQIQRSRPDLRSVDLNRLALKHYGKPYPYHIEKLDAEGRLTEESRLIFYTTMDLPTPFINVIGDNVPMANFFQLFFDAAPEDVLRFRPTARATANVSALPIRETVLQMRRLEPNLVWEYFQPAPGQDTLAPTDFRFWVKLSRPETTANRPVYQAIIPLPDVTPSDETGRLRMHLWGVTAHGDRIDHAARLSINGNEIANGQWSGRQPYTLEGPIPGNLFQTKNEMTLELIQPANASAPPFDVVMLDWMELEYPRRPVAQKNYVAFTSQTKYAHSVRVGGFNTDALTALDVDRAQILEVSTKRQPPLFLGREATIALEGPTSTALIYGADTPLKPVSFLSQASQSRLRELTPVTDYLIITPKEFVHALKPLIRHRERDGLRVQLVEAESIYQEFAGDFPGAKPIRDFVAHAYKNWGQPRYLLLVGDSCAVSALRTYLPTHSFNTMAGDHASDNWFAMIDEDDIPDMAVGRISARAPEEVSLIVDKIIARETRIAGGLWRREALFIAASTNWAARAAQHIIKSKLFPSIRAILLRTDRKATTLETHKELTKEITDQLNSGRAFTIFIGHGGGTIWQVGPSYNEKHFEAHLFDQSHVRNLTNDRRPTIVLGLTCFTNDFDHPHFPETIGESFLRAPGGAAAVIAPSGRTTDQASEEFARHFFHAALVDGEERVGDAILHALEAGEDVNLRKHLILLGDPAMKIMMPRKILSFRNPNKTALDVTQTSNAIWLSGRLEGANFSGKGQVVITDSEGTEIFSESLTVQDGLIHHRVVASPPEGPISPPLSLSVYVYDPKLRQDWLGSVPLNQLN